MSIKKIDEFPAGGDSISPDDIFLFMDDPSGNKVTKRIFLSELASIIGGGGAISGTTFQISTVDLHNGGVQNAQVLKFDNTEYQSVITGPTPASGNSSQRIIIQGQKAEGNGEGGDVYLWGGDADVNGGDIKIYAGDADSNESGNGGYINIDAGNGYNQGGQVSITAGNSSVQGGSVNINAGYPSGNVSINTNAGTWAFNTDGTVDLPSSTLNLGLNSLDLKSSAYVELYYQSGPSGTSNNYIEIPNNNSEAYLWTTYDGTWIGNYRSNDGTNPSWNYEWHFRNDGKLEYPDGTTNSGGTVIVPGTYNIQSIDNTLIQTSANTQAKSWNFDTNGGLTLPQGSMLSETNNTVSLMPPTAASGQSLVIRPTVAGWGLNSSGYITYGSPITISVTLQSWSYFGTVNYVISGTGVTEQSLGRALTGKLTFSNTSAPETENITWTIPANSNISEFTLTLTSVDGTRPGPEIADANLYPTLYYNFEESYGMPNGQFITVTNNGISSSEHSHVHLVAGDPSTVDIYLGDDDQYVKIEKDGGDVIVGTNSNTNRWTFGTNGSLTLPREGEIVQAGYNLGPYTVADGNYSGGDNQEIYISMVDAPSLGSMVEPGDLLGDGANPSSTTPIVSITNDGSYYTIVASHAWLSSNPQTVIFSRNSSTWTFDKNGKLTLPGGYAQVVVEEDSGVRIGTAGTNVAPNNQIKIGGAEHALEIFGGPPGYSWKFDANGELTLPASGSITFPDSTTQTSAGVPSNTGLVPNSISITNMISISQANYDALVTKDSSTLYVIS